MKTIYEEDDYDYQTIMRDPKGCRNLLLIGLIIIIAIVICIIYL